MRILHLEDDGALRNVLRLVLVAVEPSLHVHQFISSDDALQFISQNEEPIDLYIIDIRVMGKRDGISVAQHIRDAGHTAPIVLTSAYKLPKPEVLETLDCIWMPKPWELINAPHVLLPMARQHYESRTART